MVPPPVLFPPPPPLPPSHITPCLVALIVFASPLVLPCLSRVGFYVHAVIFISPLSIQPYKAPVALISAYLRHYTLSRSPNSHSHSLELFFWSHRWLCVLLGSSTPPMRFNLCRTLCVRLVLHYTLAMRCIFYLFCSCFIVQYRCIVTALSIVVCCCRRRRHNHTTIVFAHCVCLHLQSPSGVCSV